ncbi:WD40 repeat domain-containing protein, partial [Cellulomonas endophytica]|uniref:WD40 repeat domain-containing protein n=1 Tax=Cellulomonas endophytica TaxID=2494735 RepID=UPI00196B5B7B
MASGRTRGPHRAPLLQPVLVVSPATAPGHVDGPSACHDAPVRALAFDPSGTRLATAGEDRSARL